MFSIKEFLKYQAAIFPNVRFFHHFLFGEIAGTVNDAEVNGLASENTFANKRDSFGFSTIEDIVSPNDIPRLELNKDFFLLIHRTNCVSLIQQQGLRNFKSLAGDKDASSETIGLYNLRNTLNVGNDPGLIYVMPIFQQADIEDGDLQNSVFLAVKPEKVFVYNQEHRSFNDRLNFGVDQYKSSKIPISDFNKNYNFPEVCFGVDRIGPEFFIRPEVVSSLLLPPAASLMTGFGLTS